MTKSIYWHDYEAWGADPRQDRASQFAGIRTSLDLEEMGEPLMMYCQPAPDRLPHPRACLITGITPQYARSHGVPEVEFVRRIHQQFSEPGTCVAGYNSIRFDDELTRQLLYRNFYDPYEREWKHGNSRWDIIDMLRLCHAVRPEGINWVTQDDGSPVFRLELLSQANGLLHDDAHDALADVRATIGMARKVRQAQPKLFQFVFDLRSKQRVLAMIDLREQKPLLHVSAMYAASRYCMAPVMPLALHPGESNGVLLYDLSCDPRPWLAMDDERLHYHLFTAKRDLLDGETRLPVAVMHTNRCPVIAPLAVLDDCHAPLPGMDLAAARQHWQLLRRNPGFCQRLLAVFGQRQRLFPDVHDPDQQLYSGGFFSDADKRLMADIRQLGANELRLEQPRLLAAMRDQRLPEMLFRYRARNFPHSLTQDEQMRWKQWCRHNWMPSPQAMAVGSTNPETLDLARCRALIREEREDPANTGKSAILDELEQWLSGLEQWALSSD